MPLTPFTVRLRCEPHSLQFGPYPPESTTHQAALWTRSQSSSVIRVSMVGSSQTDPPGVTDPRTWESTHRILDPIRPHRLGRVCKLPLRCDCPALVQLRS